MPDLFQPFKNTKNNNNLDSDQIAHSEQSDINLYRQQMVTESLHAVYGSIILVNTCRV